MNALDFEAAIRIGRDLGEALPPLTVLAREQAIRAIVSELASRDGEAGCDALLVTEMRNVRYLTGFTGSTARLLITPNTLLLQTDFRYGERARDELDAASSTAELHVMQSRQEQDDALRERLTSVSAVRVGLEADTLSWSQADGLRNGWSEIGVSGVATNGLVENLRRTKDAAEIARLARASRVADDALAMVLPRLGTGVTERQFARALERAMEDLGAEERSFATIVASGPNASRPHHEPTDRVIEEGDAVICDFGATVDGYHSDMTRTVFVGEPSMQQRRHFSVVHDAQRAGIAALGPGATGVDIDAACRAVIEAVGWLEFFNHGTGHGSGLQIHEAPWAGKTSTSTMAVGDILTIEPGVYLPGSTGVRIEDSFVVSDAGPLFLTGSPYDLVV